jgi:hypothetical protein
MTMAEMLAELRALSDEELIARHDRQAPRTVVGTNHYLVELARRDQDRQTQAMLDLTRSIRTLTLIVTVATGIGVLMAVLQVYAVFFP